jgi:hypothetical protein
MQDPTIYRCAVSSHTKYFLCAHTRDLLCVRTHAISCVRTHERYPIKESLPKVLSKVTDLAGSEWRPSPHPQAGEHRTRAVRTLTNHSGLPLERIRGLRVCWKVAWKLLGCICDGRGVWVGAARGPAFQPTTIPPSEKRYP